MGVRGLDNKDINPTCDYIPLNMGVRGLDNKDINPTCDYISLNMGVRGLDNKDISYLWLYFFEHGSERSRQQGYLLPGTIFLWTCEWEV